MNNSAIVGLSHPSIEATSIPGANQARLRKQGCLILTLGIAVCIIFEFGVLYGSWVGFNQLGWQLYVIAPVMAVEGVLVLAICLLVMGIAWGVLRNRAEDRTRDDRDRWANQMQTAGVRESVRHECIGLAISDWYNGTYDSTGAKYLNKATQLEEESRKNDQLIRNQNIDIITAFCKHMFQFSDSRISSILTQACIAEATKWEKSISEEVGQLDICGIDLRSIYKQFSRFNGAAPELVEVIEFKLLKQLQCADVVCELLETSVDTDIIVRGLSWLFFAPRPIPWNQIDLLVDNQSVKVENALTNSLEYEDIQTFKKKVISIINGNAFQKMKEKAILYINNIKDQKLLNFLKSSLIEKEQQIKKMFANSIIIYDTEELWKNYKQLLDSKIELYRYMQTK